MASSDFSEAAKGGASRPAVRLRLPRYLLWLMPATLAIVALWLAWPAICRQSKAGNLTWANNGAKNIGLALQMFDSEYGCYPSESTAGQVKASTQTSLTLGSSSSNQLFRQLIATGLKSEKPFYAEIAGCHVPDDRFDDDAHALAPGECGFAYIAGLSHASPPRAPVVVCPLIPGTTRFDRKPFDGKAVILFNDNSASEPAIDELGRVMIDGMDIFDPRQPFWDGKAPDLKPQE